MTVSAAFATTGFLLLFILVGLGAWTAAAKTWVNLTLSVIVGFVTLACFLLAIWLNVV